MNPRGTPLTLLLPLLLGPFACSLLAESELVDKPLTSTSSSGGTGGSGGVGGVGGNDGGAGAAPCSIACASGEACCMDACVDLATSVDHCGTCGNTCAAGERCCGAQGCAACCEKADCPQDHECQANVCVIQCQAPAVPCGDVCAVLLESTPHCGTCDNDCLAGHTCTLGVCQPGWATMTKDSAPSARQRAAATWAGTKLFVWGGQNAQGALADGALYDPKTDVWSPVSSMKAPTARVDAVAVWTGDRVLVWGGGPENSQVAYMNGALYDPANDTWTDEIIAPLARRAPIALYTGSRVLIWGGSSGGSPIAGGFLYNPGGAWTQMSTANAPNARTNAGYVWSGTEFILFGGRPLGSGASNEGFAYNPTMDKWRSLSTVSAPTARYDVFTVWMQDKMLVYGGRDAGGAFDDAAIYTPMGDTWTSAPSNAKRSAPAGRTGFPGFLGTRAFLVGGLDTSQKPTTDGHVFDAANNVWLDPIPGWMPPAYHEYGVGVWTGAELILWGGLDNNGALTTNGERYRP